MINTVLHKGRSGWFSGRIMCLIAIFMPILLCVQVSVAQEKIKAPVKLKIEDGDFDQVSVILKNNTTNESNSLPGSAKFDLELKMNCEYVISFTKPGYITKRIAFNTKAPVERISQGFYGFNFEVNLFQQYDGVNIVVFNQPVGKISYNRLIDDFDYDTDYTKQIQSALKQAEEEIIKKQKEAKVLAEKNKKAEEKKKIEEEAAAKALAKAKIEEEKLEAANARNKAIEDTKQKKIEEDERKLLAKANLEEEKRKAAIAVIEEEERARLKAAEDEDKRRQLVAGSGEEQPAKSAAAISGEDQKNKAKMGSGFDEKGTSGGMTGSDGKPGQQPDKSSGQDELQQLKAEPISKTDGGISKAKPVFGVDSQKTTSKAIAKTVTEDVEESYEKMPDISVEEIEETNRMITRVTVRKDQKETVFLKVIYNWGGIYYFRSTLSISESLYFSSTGLK